MRTLNVCIAAAVVTAAGTVLADGDIADVTEQLSLLTAVFNGTNSYRAAQAESHLGHLRVWNNVGSRNGTAVTFDVDDGKTLTIDKLRGGRGVGSTFTKTGGGTLCIGDGAPYGGTLVMEGGTLAMSKKVVPKKPQLPANSFLHLDASDVDSLVRTMENGTNYVTFWASDGVGSVAGRRVVGVQASESWKHPKYFRPWLLENALGSGLHALDFGEWNSTAKKYYEASTYEDETWPVACGGFTFVTNENYEASAQVLPPGFRTFIAVVGAHRGGGTVLCDSSHTKAYGQHPFERGTNRDASKKWDYPIAHPYTYGSETVTPTVWQDGRRVDVSQKFDSPAFHIIAEKCDPKDFAFKFIGASTYTDKQIIHGGMILAELFVYDRDLSEAEILDVQAYLADKWFSAATPGYRFEDGPADLPNVTVATESTIYVPDGVTNRIGSLVLNAPLVKAGGGTLEVFDMSGDGRVTFAGGEIRYADRPDSGDELCAIAPGASLHLDPTIAGTMYSMGSVNGTNKVYRMSSVSGLINMIGPNYQPTIVTNNTLNSLPMLFFSDKGGGQTYGGYLAMDKPLDGIRSVFIIWDPKPYTTDGAGNSTIGAYNYADYHADNKNENCFDFLRDNVKSGNNARLIGNNANDVAMAGVTVVTNGVTSGFTSTYPADDFELVEFHLDNPAHASGVKLVLNRTQSSGLGMMGDLIIYERELTERERVQTRNYLMRKWFNAAPKALPEKPASRAGQYIPKTVIVDGETSIEPENAISNLILKGEGVFVKRGTAEVQALSLLDFTGTVEVAEGKFVLNGFSTGYAPKMATQGQTLRFDMSEGVIEANRALNGYFVYTVTNLAAESSTVATVKRGDYPTIIEEELNGLPVVKMPSGKYMQFYDAAGNSTYLDDIQSLFWVIGSQEGGGFLMGGGTNRHTNTLYPWHRGTKTVGGEEYTGLETGGHIAPLTNSNGQKEFLKAAFRLNFADKTYSTGLSGGYDLLSMVIPELDGETYKYPLNAQGFAFDGRSGFIKKGCQRLGEVLAYNRRLSAQEVRETETYLAVKWGLCNAVRDGETLSGVVVDSGATLDLGSTTQKVAFVSGGGDIVNGCVETPTVKYDFDDPATLSADVFSFADGFTVELLNVSSETADGFYPIISASEFVGLDNARVAVVVAVPSLPAGKPAKPMFRAGVFGVRIGCPGLSIIFR